MKKNLSQLKRQRQNEKRNLRNRSLRSHLRLSIREAREAVAKDPSSEETSKSVHSATRKVDKMVTKGLLKKQTAGRYKSRIMKHFNSNQPAQKAPTPEPESKPAETSEE